MQSLILDYDYNNTQFYAFIFKKSEIQPLSLWMYNFVYCYFLFYFLYSTWGWIIFGFQHAFEN